MKKSCGMFEMGYYTDKSGNPVKPKKKQEVVDCDSDAMDQEVGDSGHQGYYDTRFQHKFEAWRSPSLELKNDFVTLCFDVLTKKAYLSREHGGVLEFIPGVRHLEDNKKQALLDSMKDNMDVPSLGLLEQMDMKAGEFEVIAARLRKINELENTASFQSAPMKHSDEVHHPGSIATYQLQKSQEIMEAATRLSHASANHNAEKLDASVLDKLTHNFSEPVVEKWSGGRAPEEVVKSDAAYIRRGLLFRAAEGQIVNLVDDLYQHPLIPVLQTHISGVSFAKVLELLPGMEEDHILSLLNQHALLVRGLWVYTGDRKLKAEVEAKYPVKRVAKRKAGLVDRVVDNNDARAKARMRYLLRMYFFALFALNGDSFTISREEVQKELHCRPQVLKEELLYIATLDPHKRWKYKHNMDAAFIHAYGNKVNHTELHEANKKRAIKYIRYSASYGLDYKSFKRNKNSDPSNSPLVVLDKNETCFLKAYKALVKGDMDKLIKEQWIAVGRLAYSLKGLSSMSADNTRAAVQEYIEQSDSQHVRLNMIKKQIKKKSKRRE